MNCRDFSLPGQNDQPELPEVVQSGSTHQAAASGLHHPHPPLDLRPVLQGDQTLTQRSVMI